MSAPLKKGTNICVVHEHYPVNFTMPSMDIATDHYNIGFTISGDRKNITQFGSYIYQAGDVTLLPPFVYHRTTFQSDKAYEKIMIKYSPKFAEPFIREMGQNVFDYLNDSRVFHFSPSSQKKICKMFWEMFDEYNKNKPYSEFILQGMLFRLFTTILDEHITNSGSEIQCTNLTLPVMTAVTYIETFYYRNPTLEETAQIAGMSAGYFSKIFHRQLEQTYSSYLNNVKLKHAAAMLINTGKTIIEIALETGFCHGNYLSEKFKEYYGISPKEYRNMRK